MRVLFVNAVCGIGSTGRICVDAARRLESEGHEVKIAYGRGIVPEKYNKYAVRIGYKPGVYYHALMTKLFDKRGVCSKHATRRFILWAEKYDPDLLWLHNLHDYFINYEVLFEWIKSRPKMQVKWTQHDCWAFTGGCMHFLLNDCNQWQEQCLKCPAMRKTKFIRTEKTNFERKKAAFTGVHNMTIVAVSKWIAGLVSKSFLKEYPIDVCYNRIDETVFKPTSSDFRTLYGLQDKKIILGVSSVWIESKGWGDFLKLSQMIDSSFALVLVGVTKKQQKQLPNNVIGIIRTNDAKELAEIYTAADVFVNLTYEDNYPTVNLESQACGTPCITYRTGGSPESVPCENVVEQGNLQGVLKRIYELCENR